MVRFYAIVFCLLMGFLVPIKARSLPIPVELESHLSQAATATYNLDFNLSEHHLSLTEQLAPGHPAPYFLRVMNTWYNLSYDSLLKRDNNLERLLLIRADETIRVAKVYAKNRENRAVAYLYWGGALGAKGWYHVSRKQWLRAYFSGKKGLELVQKAIELDPQVYESNLGIGMYEYYASTLGPLLKALSSFMIRGNKQSAIEKLELAENRSKLVGIEAAYFLWNAAMDENRMADARLKLAHLYRVYPESPLFKWCEIQINFYERKWAEVMVLADVYIAAAVRRAEHSGNTAQSSKLLAKVYYHAGLAAENSGQLDRAQTYFIAASNAPAEFAGWKVMALLERGKIYAAASPPMLILKLVTPAAVLREIVTSRTTSCPCNILSILMLEGEMPVAPAG